MFYTKPTLFYIRRIYGTTVFTSNISTQIANSLLVGAIIGQLSFGKHGVSKMLIDLLCRPRFPLHLLKRKFMAPS